MTEAKLMPAPDISSEVLHSVEEEGAKDTPALVLARSEWVEKFLSMLHLEEVTWDGPEGLHQAQEVFEEYQDTFVLEPGEIGLLDWITDPSCVKHAIKHASHWSHYT